MHLVSYDSILDKYVLAQANNREVLPSMFMGTELPFGVRLFFQTARPITPGRQTKLTRFRLLPLWKINRRSVGWQQMANCTWEYIMSCLIDRAVHQRSPLVCPVYTFEDESELLLWLADGVLNFPPEIGAQETGFSWEGRVAP